MSEFEEQRAWHEDHLALRILNAAQRRQAKQERAARIAAHRAWLRHWRTRLAGRVARVFARILDFISVPEPQLQDGDLR